MKLFDLSLPEPVPENAEKIIRLAQEIHKTANEHRVRKTRMWKWDDYWVKAYDAILSKLKSRI